MSAHHPPTLATRTARPCLVHLLVAFAGFGCAAGGGGGPGADGGSPPARDAREADTSRHRDGAATTDGAAPRDGAATTDGAVPRDGAATTDGGAPRDGAATADGSCRDDEPGCRSATAQTMATGVGYTCALFADGTLHCWGSYAGAPDGRFVEIDAGPELCGVRDDGSLACWKGYLGERAVPGGSFIDVSSGTNQVCAVTDAHELRCWVPDRPETALFVPSGSFEEVSVGSAEDGVPFACGLHPSGRITCFRDGASISAPTAPDFVEVSAGHEIACGLHATGEVECFGDTRFLDRLSSVPGVWGSIDLVHQWRDDGARFNVLRGLSPEGEFVYHSSGLSGMPADVRFVQLDAAPDGHACGVSTDGDIVCFGDESYGQGERPTFGTYTEVGASFGSSGFGCAIDRTSGTPDCWGNPDYDVVADVPDVALEGLALGKLDSTAAAPDNPRACGIAADGSLRCWGTPLGTLPPGPFRQISIGSNTACGVLDDGAATCFGSYAAELDAPAGSAFREVRVGRYHACGLETDGTLQCWGRGTRGQLDAPSGEFTQVVAYGYRSCALTSSGSVHCWGDDRDPWTALDGLSPVEIGLYGDTLCGRTSTGRVECEGSGPSPDPTIPFESLAGEGGVPCGLRAEGAPYCFGDVQWGIHRSAGGS